MNNPDKPHVDLDAKTDPDIPAVQPEPSAETKEALPAAQWQVGVAILAVTAGFLLSLRATLDQWRQDARPAHTTPAPNPVPRPNAQVRMPLVPREPDAFTREDALKILQKAGHLQQETGVLVLHHPDSLETINAAFPFRYPQGMTPEIQDHRARQVTIRRTDHRLPPLAIEIEDRVQRLADGKIIITDPVRTWIYFGKNTGPILEGSGPDLTGAQQKALLTMLEQIGQKK